MLKIDRLMTLPLSMALSKLISGKLVIRPRTSKPTTRELQIRRLILGFALDMLSGTSI